MTWKIEQRTRHRPEWHRPKGLMNDNYLTLKTALEIAKAMRPPNGTIRVRGDDDSVPLQINSTGNVNQSEYQI